MVHSASDLFVNEVPLHDKREDNDDDKEYFSQIPKACNLEDSELDTPRFNTSEPGRGEIRHMQL